MEGAKEDRTSWGKFLRHMKERGLNGVRLFISDKSMGLVDTLPDFYPEAGWQRCTVHFYRDVMNAMPQNKRDEAIRLVKTIHHQESRACSLEKAKQVASKLREMKLPKAAKVVEEGAIETLGYYDFPAVHWQHLRTNNPLERINREIRRRTRVVGCFHDEQSAIMLISARLRHITATKWRTVRYMNMKPLYDQELMAGTKQV